ncbi:MAG: non-ribosomal peptide synthetase, partial [Xenococcaceae cyanobacterium]
PLPDLAIQYVDFAHWQRQWLQDEVLAKQINYWKHKLDNLSPALKLPFDRPRPIGVQTYKGDRRARMLPKNLNDTLNNLSQQLGVTLFMILMSAFEIMLYRYCGQEDILLSFASSGRTHTETERIVGFFSNTLLLRNQISGELTFRQLLDRVRESSLEAYTHQDIPFEKLIEELPPEQRQSRSPLFQVKFALNPPWSNNRGMAQVELEDITFTSLFGYIYHGKTKYDLILVMREQDEGLGMVFDYNADLFEATTIERMLGHFQSLLEGIAIDPDSRICDLPLLTHQEQKLLNSWTSSALVASEKTDNSIHEIFEAQVKQTPEAIALVTRDKQITYQQLNDRADELANYLLSLNLKPEFPVVICLDRSQTAIISSIAVLKAGGVCIPLDPHNSSEHWSMILKEVKPSIVLTQQSFVEKLAPYTSASIICLDRNEVAIVHRNNEKFNFKITGDNKAYIIYSSDLLGVNFSHRNIVRASGIGHRGGADTSVTEAAKSEVSSDLFSRRSDLSCRRSEYKAPSLGIGHQEICITASEKILQFAPLNDSLSLLEIWGTLLKGGCLVVLPFEDLHPEAIG